MVQMLASQTGTLMLSYNLYHIQMEYFEYEKDYPPGNDHTSHRWKKEGTSFDSKLPAGIGDMWGVQNASLGIFDG